MTSQRNGRECRLCGSATEFAFQKTLLNFIRAGYYLCHTCRSLQTEEPWWLPLAYGPEAERFDTGKATRSLTNFFSLPSLLRILGVQQPDPIVDWGGGGGLLSRLMRDLGYNYYCYDRHLSPEYMNGFGWQSATQTGSPTITLFEVAEHFGQPREEWGRIFALKPPLILGSTELLRTLSPDWPYLAPENGQHVFFYSAHTLQWIAQQYGYSTTIIGPYFALTPASLHPTTTTQLTAWLGNQEAEQRTTFHQWQHSRYQNSLVDQRALQTQILNQYHDGTVVIDLIFFQYHRTGIARLWESLFNCWEHTPFAKQLLLLDREGTAPHYKNIRSVTIPRHRYGARSQDITILQQACDAHNAATFLSTYYTRPASTPSTMVVYDMIPEALAMDLTDPMWLEKADAIAHAQNFIAISQSTQVDLSRFYGIAPERITVAHCGVDQRFQPGTAQEVQEFRNRFAISRPYLLFVGSRGGYKNTQLLFSAFQYLPQPHDLEILFTGGHTTLEPHLQKLSHGVPHRICQLSDEDLVLAYSGAVALIYPSYYEGFGLPLLEAMACGCPVITTRTSSIPEVAQGHAIYIPPNSPQALSKAICEIRDPARRQLLIAGGRQHARGFRWELMAERMRRIFLENRAPPSSDNFPLD